MNMTLARSCLVVIVVWGLWSFFNKLAADGLQARPAVIWSCIFTTLANVVMVAWLLHAGTPVKWERGVAFSFLGSATASVGFLIWMTALEGANASLVVPLTALYPAVTVVLLVTLRGERVSLVNLGGILLALAAVFMICYQPKAAAEGAAPATTGSPAVEAAGGER